MKKTSASKSDNTILMLSARVQIQAALLQTIKTNNATVVTHQQLQTFQNVQAHGTILNV